LRTSLATGDPEPATPPVFTRVCLVDSPPRRGNGFFIGGRGYVITAAHVICEARAKLPPKVFVSWVFTGTTFLFAVPTVVVCHDWRSDIAVLRLDDPDVLPRPLLNDSVTMPSLSPAMLGDRIFCEAFQPAETGGHNFRRLEGV